MMRLMIEEVRYDSGSRILVGFAFAIYVINTTCKEAGVHSLEEAFDTGVFFLSCEAQFSKVVIQDCGERRSVAVAHEPCQPDAVAQQDVVEQRVNAAKGSWPLLSVLGVLEIRARRIEALISNPVVPCQHSKMARE